MAEKVIIEVELDTSGIDKGLDRARSTASKKGREIGNEIETSVGSNLGKNITVQFESIGASADSLTRDLGKTAHSVNNIFSTISGASAAAISFGPLIKNFSNIKELAGDLGKILFKSKGLFGFTSSLAAVSGTLGAVSLAFRDFDSQILKTISTISKAGAIIIGGFAAAISLVIVKVGQLAQQGGAQLAAFFVKAASGFEKTQESVVILTSVIGNYNRSTNNAIGTTDQWNRKINELSGSFNVNGNSVRKAAQEIIAVGSQFGFSRKELEKLLQVSVEYAKVNRKDVFQTSVAIVSALQGSSQAVQNLGIKLNEAAVQQFAYRNGINKTVGTMSEQEKVQLRYNKLLKSYKDISGVAAVAASSLADQQRKLKINQDRLSASLGAGAAIIERNNILAAGLNVVLDNVSDSVLKVTGFVGALGARVLQAGGFFLEWGLKIFAVIKAVKILNAILSSKVGISAFAANIPLVNRSLNSLISNIAGVETRITSLSSLMQAFKIAGTSSLNSITTTLFGVKAAALSIGKAFTGAFFKIGTAIRFVIPLIGSLSLIILPIAIKVGLLIGAFKLLSAGLSIIEKKTGIFSETWRILNNVLTNGISVFDPVIAVFKRFSTTIINVANKAFGFFVDKLAGMFSIISGLVAKNPFGVFSQDTVVAFKGMQTRLDAFRGQIQNVAFDLRRLPGDVSRSIAGTNEAIKEVNLEDLAALREEFKNFGKSDLVLLEENILARTELINNSLAQDLLTQQEYEDLKSKIVKDGSDKRFAIVNKSAIEATKQINKTLNNGLVRVVQGAMANLGKQLAGGSFSFKAFVGTVLNIIGDLMLQLSAAFIAIGFGIEAIKLSIVNMAAGPALAAGLALALLGGALKTFGSSYGGDSSGVGTGSSLPGGGGFGSVDGGGGFGAELPEEEERQANQAVTVNIEGNVFDTQETGLRIVDIINEEFERNGTTILQGA